MKKRRKTGVNRTTPNDKKIAVIWTRVSTKEQADNNLSLETQEKACLDYARRCEIGVERIMGQTNESAKTEGKLYQEMIAYVSSHRHINTILVYSFDRFSRAGAEAIVTKAFLKSKGITVVSVTQPIDTDSMAGEFLENMIFLFNQFENNLRREKCTAGMIECLERGEWYTRPPVGYVIDRTAKEKHRLSIDDKGILIGQAFHWRLDEGLSDAQIVERLRTHGWQIYKQRLTEIFHNPFYCGIIQHHLLGGKTVRGIHPPIVDEDTFNRVNGIETHIGYSHAEETPATPLKLLIKCKQCGRYLTGYEVKRKHLYYYKCSGKGCNSNVSARILHSLFCGILTDYCIQEDKVDMLIRYIQGLVQEYEIQSTETLSNLQKQKSSLKTRLLEATTRFGTGEIAEDVYSITRDNLNKKIDETDLKINSLQKTHSNHTIDIRRAITIASNLSNYWKSAPYAAQQVLQKSCFPDGLNFHRESGLTLTDSENPFLKLIRLYSMGFDSHPDTKKEDFLSEILCSSGDRT